MGSERQEAGGSLLLRKRIAARRTARGDRPVVLRRIAGKESVSPRCALFRQPTPPVRALRIALGASVAFALGAGSAFAQTWTGAGGNSDWSTAANWQGGAAPTTGSAVILTGGGFSTYDLGSPALASVTLNPASTNYVISPNNPSVDIITLENGGFITDNRTGAGDGFDTAIALHGPAVFTAASNASLNFDAAISGNGGLTLTAAANGGINLVVANNYAGPTTINGAGVVELEVNGAAPTGSALTVNGAALFLQNSTVGSLAGTGVVQVDAATLTVGGDNTSTTFSGVIENFLVTNAAALTKTGTGTLTLTGTSAYSGGTTITGGLINFSSASNFGTGQITLNGGGLQWATGTTTDISSRLNAIGVNGGTFDTNGNNVALASALSGAGGMTKAGAGTLTFTGTNNYAGGTTITGGLINFNSASNFGSGQITLNGGGLQWATGNTTDISSRLNAIGTSGGTFDTNGNNVAMASVIAGAGVTKAGSGVLTLTRTNTYSGGTTISGGTLALSGSGSIASSSGVTDNATFDISNTNSGASVEALSGAGIVNLGAKTLTLSNANAAFSGAINGTGGLTLTGGTETLSGNNTYTGLTQIGAGATLALSGSGSIAASQNVGFSSGGVFDVSQATSGASIGGLNDSSGLGRVSLGAQSLTIAIGGQFNGVIQDGGIAGGKGGSLILGPKASLNLGGVNTYAGPTIIGADANLELTANGSIATSSNVTVNGGFHIESLGDGVTPVGASIVSLSGANAETAVILGVNNLIISNAIGTFAGVITGKGGVTIAGGTEILTGNGNYTGGTTINSGATLQLGAGGTSAEIEGNVVDNGVLAFAGAGTTGSFSAISGAGAVHIMGAVDVQVVGANSFSGGTVISSGVLTAGGNGAVGTGTVTLDGGTFRAGGGGLSFNNLFAINATGGTIDTQAATLTLSLSGPIVDGDRPGALTIIGGGTLVLSGASSYTGPTTVASGTLDVTGSLGNTAVTVQNGAKLEGAGSIAGRVTIANGATLAPGGGAPGTITLGSLTLSAGSILSYQLGGTSGGGTGGGGGPIAVASRVGSSGAIAAVGGGGATPPPVPAGGGGPSPSSGNGGPSPSSGSGGTGNSSNSLTVVNGALTINGGTLFVADSGGFGPGTYPIINYTGALGGSGQLAVGAAPDGDTGVIQVNAGQIDLVVSGPAPGTQFWDGGTLIGDGRVHGGSGTWDNGTTNWTSQDGTTNASWQGDSAVFMGAAGTVKVAEVISFQSLQFSTDGYRVTATTGGALAPNGSATIIVDPAFSATIAAPILGQGGIDKNGLGALILTGANAYTGGTTIEAGTLQIGNGRTSGSIAGDVLDAATLAFDHSDAITFPGMIAGPGAVRQIGSGSLTLTGANAYDGGTMLSAGTLVIGNNRALGTGTLSMAAGTTLSFLNAGNFTVSNPIKINGDPSFAPPAGTTQTLSGVISDGASPGTLAMNGAGTLVLSATETYTGPTNVASGTLDVTGSIASSSLTRVASGATLTGSGAIGSLTIASGGVFAPGSGTVGASTNVFGALAFNAGATYQVQVSPAAAAFAKVSGSASLAGSVSAVFGSGAYVTKQYTILTASGGLGGATFASLANINLSAGFTDSLSYDANDVYLNLKAKAGAISTAGLNAGQLNLANALNGVFNATGSLPPAFVNGIAGGSSAGAALTQLSGEGEVGAQQAAFQFTNSFLSLMLDPYTENRGGFAGASGLGGPLGYAGDERTPSVIGSAFSALSKDKPGVIVDQPAWTVWGAAFGGGEQVSGNAALGSHETSSVASGGVVGADYHVSPDATLGFALAYGGMNWSVSDGLGGGRSDVFQAGLYGAEEFGPAYVAAAASFGDAWVTTNRSVTLPGGGDFTANFNAQGFGGRIESGYRIALAPARLTPYAAVQAQDFHTPSYSETALSGAPAFALSYASQSATDTRFELGAWVDKTIATPSGDALKLFGRAAWAHDWQSNPQLTATFQSLPAAGFVVNGAKPAADEALVTAGLEWRFAKNWTAMVKFEGAFGSGTETYAGTGRLTYSW